MAGVRGHRARAGRACSRGRLTWTRADAGHAGELARIALANSNWKRRREVRRRTGACSGVGAPDLQGYFDVTPPSVHNMILTRTTRLDPTDAGRSRSIDVVVPVTMSYHRIETAMSETTAGSRVTTARGVARIRCGCRTGSGLRRIAVLGSMVTAGQTEGHRCACGGCRVSRTSIIGHHACRVRGIGDGARRLLPSAAPRQKSSDREFSD